MGTPPRAKSRKGKAHAPVAVARAANELRRGRAIAITGDDGEILLALAVETAGDRAIVKLGRSRINASDEKNRGRLTGEFLLFRNKA